jgi:hypothetical protein
MKTEINLQKEIKEQFPHARLENDSYHQFSVNNMIDFAKSMCEKTVELCAENAELIYFDNAEIDKDSILNTKNQIV